MKSLSDILPDSLPNNLQTYIKVRKVWEASAGDVISFVTTSGSIKDGVLNVAVHDHVWLSELAMFKGDLIARINEKGLDINNINFYYRARKEYFKPAIISKKEMTDREREFADRLVSTVKDEKLRESFKKAIYGYFTVYTIDDYLKC